MNHLVLVLTYVYVDQVMSYIQVDQITNLHLQTYLTYWLISISSLPQYLKDCSSESSSIGLSKGTVRSWQ